jgi:hypothetical protein
MTNWFKQMVNRPLWIARRPAKRARNRLVLEALEDRVVPAVTDLTTSTGYPTIQAAVNAANTGDTLLADPGTYSENVTVNKTLTIWGAQHGVDARGARGAESIVDGTSNGGLTPFTISANDVIIDGFTVQGATNPNNVGAGIYIKPGVHGTHIVNNVVQDNIIGLYVANNNAVDQAVVQFNLFQNNTVAGPGGGQDIYADQFTAGVGGVNNVLIDSNTFTNSSAVDSAWAMGISNTDATPFTNITFSNNSVTNHGRGVYFYDTTNSLVTGNTITPATSGHYAVGFFNDDSNIAVTNNLITAGANTAVEVADDLGTPNASITVSKNSFSVPTPGSFDISIDPGSYTGTLNASGNWWSTAIGTNPTDPIAPTAINGLVSGAVTVGSFLDSGLNAATGNGFTLPAATEMWVPTTAATSGLTFVNGVIQSGVDTANPGMIVRVAADTYHEMVQATRTVILDGAQAGVDPRSGRAGAETIVSNGEGDFQIEADNVAIDGFTLTGVTSDPNADLNSLGTAIWTNPGFSGTHGGTQILNNIIQGNIAGIELDNDGTYQTEVQHNLFQDNHQPGANSGLDIATDFGLSNALIDSNKFTNTAFVDSSWALGVEAPSTGITFSNNVVTNHGRGVFFYATTSSAVTANSITGASHYAIGLFGSNGAPANASFTISGNILSVNGSGGAAVEVVDDSTPGFAYAGTLTLSGDTITTSGSDLSIRNESATPINATGETFNGVLAGTASTAQEYVIADTIVDGVDVTGFGLVRLKTGNVYVTPNSFFVPDGTSAPSIQRGINAASSGDTVNVEAATYAGNVQVNKSVTLLGANAGVDPNTGSRSAETIVEPGLTSSYDTDSIFVVTASNVTINGFTIQGSIPVPPVGQSAGFTLDSGTKVYAAAGISNSSNINSGGSSPSTTNISNLVVQNDIVKDFTQFGIYGDTTSNGFASTGNVITNNFVTDVPNNGNGGYIGEGILIYDNFYAAITSNHITVVRTGVQTGNNYASAGAFLPSISNNTVAAYVKGVYFNLEYASASTFTVHGNTISQANSAISPQYNVGLLVQSIQGSVLTNITGNNVSGFLYGVELANNNATTPATVQGGILNNNTYGVWDTNNDYFYPAPYDTTAAISGVTITNSTAAGIWVDSTSANSGGQFDTTDHNFLAISGGTSVTGGPVGILIAGSLSRITGNTLHDTALSGQSGNYITLTAGALAGQTLDATGASFAGITGNSLTLPQAYAVEDKIADAIDSSSLGFVRIQAGHVFVTPNSFLPPATNDTGAIQRAVNVASTGDTVNVEAGTYYDNVSVNKSLTLLGANSGIDPNTGSRGAETIAEPAVTETSLQGSTSGTIFRVGVAGQHIQATIDGFTIDGHNANLTGGRTLNGVMIDTGAGIINSIGSFDSNPGAFDATMIVQNNIIQNLERYGVLGDTGNVTTETGANVSHNKFDNLPSGNNYGGSRGRAVAFEDNYYGQVTYNVMTRVNVGYQNDNFNLADPGGLGLLIDHNTIHAYHRGIFYNLVYQSASTGTISNNNIFVDNSGLGASGTDFGVEIISIESGVSVNVTNNSDTGNTFGVLITGDSTTAGLTVSGGTLSGNKYGVYVTDNDPQFPSDGNTPNAVLSGITITGATTAGVFVEAANGFNVGATLTGGTSITGSAAAIKGTGFATLTLANVSSSGNTSGGSIAGTNGTVNITPAGGISVTADAAASTFGDGALQTISYAGATLSNLNLGTSGNNNAFSVKPITGGTTAITVDGGLPYPAGNTSTLNLDLSAVTNPVINPTGPGAGFLTTTPPANPLSWTHINVATSLAFRFDFNAATSPTQLPSSPPTPGGFIGVQTSDTYSAARGYGWVTAPVGSFDRGAIAGEADSNLLRDGVYGDTTHAATFRTDLPNGTYQVTVIQGDQTANHAQMNVAVVAGSGTGVSSVKTSAGQYAASTFQATVSSNQLSLQFSAAGLAVNQWVLNGLIIQPIPGTIGFTSGPGSVAADGTTIDTINGTAALPNGSLITVSTSMGTIVSADADTHYAGTQVVVNGGAFSFQVQRPFSIGTPTFTAVSISGAAQGSATNPAILNYTELPARRFDFNGSGNATAAGFIGVNNLGLYSATLGYGWQAAVSSFDRGSAPSQVTQALYRDGAIGNSGPASAGTFEFQVATGSSINIRVYVGDQTVARSNITVSAEGGASVPVPATAAGQFTAVTLVGTDTNGDGIITVTVSESVAGAQWVANGMDVWTNGNDPGQAPQLAAGGEAKGGGAGVPQLTQVQLAPIVQQAIAAWASAGITHAQIALLNTVQFQIGTLAPGVLGQTGLGVPLVRLDATAAGYGWFIDPTPAQNEEFTKAAGQEVAKRGTAAYGHMDLLTVVEHELGHVLGIDDLNSRSASSNLMSETLAAGVRRAPAPIVLHPAPQKKPNGRGM